MNLFYINFIPVCQIIGTIFNILKIFQYNEIHNSITSNIYARHMSITE